MIVATTNGITHHSTWLARSNQLEKVRRALLSKHIDLHSSCCDDSHCFDREAYSYLYAEKSASSLMLLRSEGRRFHSKPDALDKPNFLQVTHCKQNHCLLSVCDSARTVCISLSLWETLLHLRSVLIVAKPTFVNLPCRFPVKDCFSNFSQLLSLSKSPAFA